MMEEYGTNIDNWKWGYIHTNQYSTSWSGTYVKRLYNREIGNGGNLNTIKVSRYPVVKFHNTHNFDSFHSPMYKHVVQIGN